MHLTTVSAPAATLPSVRRHRDRWIANIRTICPGCGQTDHRGKCRFNEETGGVLCFYAPTVPLHTVVLQSDGVQRYLAATDRGFSGLHALWLPHTELEGRSRNKAPVQRPPLVSPAEALADGRRVRTAVRVALAHPLFEHCTAEQLRQHGRALGEVLKRIMQLRESLRRVRVESPEIKSLRWAVGDWEKSICHQQTDLALFLQQYLGAEVLP